MEKYYVYCHKNPTTNEIFYVGKGSGYRAYVTQSRGKFWYDYVKKHGIPIVEILHENLSEDESFILEKELIKTFGRRDINNGLLVNTTDGGEGCGGMTHSDKSKKKMSINKFGKPSNNKGKTWTFREKRPKGLKRGNYQQRKDKGKTFNEEIKLKMKEGKRNNSKLVLQYDKQNNLIKEWRCAAEAIESLKLKGIYNCLTGVSNSSGGYIWRYKL
jgi:hypothetical protein